MSTRRLNVDLHVCIEKCDAAASNQSKQHSNSHLLRNDETKTNEYAIRYDKARRKTKRRASQTTIPYDLSKLRDDSEKQIDERYIY